MAASCAVSCLRGDEARSVEGLVAMNTLERMRFLRMAPMMLVCVFGPVSGWRYWELVLRHHVSPILARNLDHISVIYTHSLWVVQNCI